MKHALITLILLCAAPAFAQTLETEQPHAQPAAPAIDSTPFAPTNSVVHASETVKPEPAKPELKKEAKEEDEPAPYPQTQKSKPVVHKAPKPTAPPQTYGDCSGKAWIGQRVTSERHAGWGWLKKEGDSWKNAKWVMLQEVPGKILAPQRFYNNPNSDNNFQYKLYGDFATYKGYEPNIDILVPIFVLKGFEVIGEAQPIERKLPGPSGRKSSISARQGAGQMMSDD